MAGAWVNHGVIFIFGWTIPLTGRDKNISPPYNWLLNKIVQKCSVKKFNHSAFITGAHSSWAVTVRFVLLSRGTEMRWWRKWLNRWHARAFVRFASLTESSQLTPCQTGTMRQTLSPTLSAPQWLALKTLFDLRYTDQFTVLDVCKHLSNLSKKPHIPFNVWASVIIRSFKNAVWGTIITLISVLICWL